jgi:hypothetical protein
MVYKIKENVTYDTDLQQQSEEFCSWYQSEVEPRLGGENALPCTKDRFGRPTEFRLELEESVVIITREYVNPKSGSWAKRCDTVTVERKEVDNE